MVGRKHTGKRELPKGFTFTISVIIISATLIAIATYASEYKQSQNAALSVAPSSDGVRIYEKVSAELAALLGADAESFRNSSSFNIKFSGGLPLKKEGAPIADLWGYSQSLAERYRTSPYEVLFVPKNGTGGNATVLLLPSSGTVRYRNNGTADLMVITHPDRWGPRTIKMWLSCEGNRSIIANLSADSGSGTQVANYAVYYSDPLGTSTSTLSGIYDTSGVRYSVLFADGSNFSFTANLSTAASNITTITYTKSPGAALILPFDDNVSTVASGAVHDYSGFGRNATLGGGLQQNAPVWRQNCRQGGCYEFNGSAFISLDNLNFTERSLLSYGTVSSPAELLSNEGFESFSGEADNQADDDFNPWVTVNNDPASFYFDATRNGANVHGDLTALNIWQSLGGGGSDSYIYQAVGGLSDSATYDLSFWTKGDKAISGRYALYSPGSDQYLQGDGSWGGYNLFDTGVTGTSYAQVTKSFQLPPGMGEVQVRFVSQEGNGGNFWVDDVSLAEASGPNFGFEQYSGSPCAFSGWASSGGSVFGCAPDQSYAHSGSMALKAAFTGEAVTLTSAAAALESGMEYSLEFWARSESGSPDSAIRYALYDENNAIYLQSDNSWGASENVFDSGAAGTDYQRVAKTFQTYGSGVGTVDIIFHPPNSETAYADDLSLFQVFDFSILAWLKAQYGPGVTVPISQRTDAADGAYGFGWQTSGSTLEASLFSGGLKQSYGLAAADGSWHHVALVVNRTGAVTYYTDASSSQGGPYSTGTLNSTASLLLGANMTGGGEDTLQDGYSGLMDEVRIYNRTLSQQEVYGQYRGNYQKACKVDIHTVYASTTTPGELASYYNGTLTIRQRLPGLEAYYPFESSPSSSITYDYSGFSRTATPVFAVWNATGGRYGGAYSFDGTKSYVAAGPILASGDWTISFWLKSRSVPASVAYPIGFGTAGGIFYDGPTATNKLGVSDGSSVFYSETAVTGTWKHIAVSKQGTLYKVYVGGNFSTSGTLAEKWPNNLNIGRRTDSEGFYFDGHLDEVRIYSRALSADEIKGLADNRYLIKQGSLQASGG